jgi:hypothetical protein
VTEGQVKGRWAWSDAWVLTAACAVGRNPVSLVDLIAAGDYINHAILLDEEIRDAVERLAAANLARLENDEVRLTEAGLQLCEEARSSGRGVLEDVNAMNRALHRLELPAEVPRSNPISPSTLRAAKERYSDSDLPT